MINLAQAYKWQECQSDCDAVLHDIDFSALGIEFRIARAVLSDSFDEATVLMKNAGKEHSVLTKQSYQIWPLFRELRKQAAFAEVYESIYDK
jgi:hypothetical protein